MPRLTTRAEGSPSASSFVYLPPLRLDMVGLGRFELPTSPLSGVRSNQLSYRPRIKLKLLVELVGIEPAAS